MTRRIYVALGIRQKRALGMSRQRCAIGVWLGALLSVTALAAAAGDLEIDGRVVDAAGRPVTGARVELRPIPGLLERAEAQLAERSETPAVAEVRCGGDGGFRISAPEAGAWRLTVRHPGHLGMSCRLEPLLGPLQLPAVTLSPRVERRIVTLDAAGRPLAGVRVAVRGYTSHAESMSRYRWRPERRFGVSGERGVLVVASAGDESLMITASTRQAEDDLAGSTSYGEGRPGAEDVRLRLTDRLVPARLVDAAGEPLAGVAVYYATAWDLALGISGPKGEIRVPYRAGEGVPRLDLADVAGLIGRVASGAAPGDGPRVLRLRPPLRVAGRVVDATSRQTVAGAWLNLVGGLERTDARGRFSVRLAFEGASFSVSALGYLARRVEVPARGAGGESRELTVALTRSLSLSGRVLDARGEAVAGADVFASPASSSSHRPDRLVHARSDAGGRFTIGGLAPDVGYQLRAARRGFAPGRLRLPALAGRSVPEVELVLETGLAASGVVLDHRRQPVAGAEVTLSTPHHPVWRTLTLSGDDAGGRFEIRDLAAGIYTLRVRTEDFVPFAAPGIEIAGEGPVDLGRAVLDRGMTLAGRVVDADGRGLEDAQILANRLPTPVREVPLQGALSGPDGEFAIAGVSPTEQLHVSAWLKGYRHRQLPPLIPYPHRPLIITLDAGVTLRGRVVDALGAGAAGVDVWIRRPGSRAGASGTRTDADGRFTFRDQAVGRVEVSAAGPAGIGDPVAFELAAGQISPEALIALRPAAEVRGRLAGPDGEALFGGSIQLSPDEVERREHWSGSDVTTGAGGRFTVPGLDGGRYRLRASHDDFEPLEQTVEVAAGVDLELDLAFERRRPPAIRVSGRVIDPGGAGVDGARVMLVTGPRVWSRFGTTSFDGGRFELEAREPEAEEKTWALLVEHPDFAQQRSEEFELTGPVASQLVQLAPGGSLSGRILGLDAARRWRLHVSATSKSLGIRYGHVTRGGDYRIDGLATGEWTVNASLGGSGRRVSEQVSLGGAGDAAEVDLVFEAAYQLNGRALCDGEPWASARAAMSCPDPSYRREVRTHADGRFLFVDVPAGSCELTLTGLVHGAVVARRRVELATDEELQIEVTTAAVAGRVLTPELTPLAGVRIEARARKRDLHGHPKVHVVTDAGGRFELRTSEPGRWRLRTAPAGFAVAELEVETALQAVDSRSPARAPDIVLEPAVPAVVYVQDDRGEIPREVDVHVRMPGSRRAQRLKLRPDAEGRVVLPALSPGTWHASFDAGKGRWSTYVEIEVPREPVVVVLEDCCPGQ